MVSLISPNQALITIAKNLRRHRLAFMYTQKEMAARSGVPLATLRKFERTGIISLESFLKIAVIIGILENVVHATAPKTEFATIDEMLAFMKKRKPRQRARKKDSHCISII